MRRTSFALLAIVVISAFLRFFNLATPNEVVFDEVYYVNGAQDYIQHGVELTDGKPEFVVHPPVGKWVIAAGIKLFGDNSFGWRFSSALVGTLSIALIFLVTRKLFNSEWLAVLASTLMALDGLHLVMSRTALLDTFLMFFLLLGFYLFISEKHWWAALSFGLALGTKWNALYLIAALIIFFIWQSRKIPWSYLTLTPATYLLSWSGWFLSDNGWDRHVKGNTFASWIYYHKEMLNFHTGLVTKHSYQANPWNWLFMGRPTSFFYATPKSCGSGNCSQEILALGTPFLWWTFIATLAVTIGYFIYQRERIAGLILITVFANYLPWFLFQKRTTFSFYTIAFEPFLILCVIYVAAKALENDALRKRRTQLISLGTAAIAACFLYFLPLYLGSVINYSEWYARMWFPNWI